MEDLNIYIPIYSHLPFGVWVLGEVLGQRRTVKRTPYSSTTQGQCNSAGPRTSCLLDANAFGKQRLIQCSKQNEFCVACFQGLPMATALCGQVTVALAGRK